MPSPSVSTGTVTPSSPSRMVSPSVSASGSGPPSSSPLPPQLKPRPSTASAAITNVRVLIGAPSGEPRQYADQSAGGSQCIGETAELSSAVFLPRVSAPSPARRPLTFQLWVQYALFFT